MGCACAGRTEESRRSEKAHPHEPLQCRFPLAVGPADLRGDRNGARVARVEDPAAAAAAADLTIVVQPHQAYDLGAMLADAPLVLDTRGRLTGPNVERL
jgi:hypothetical protein